MKEQQSQEVEAILEHVLGDFLVGFIAYHEQIIHFRVAVGGLVKKIIFYLSWFAII